VNKHLGELSRNVAMDAASLAFAHGGVALRIGNGQNGRAQVRFTSAGQSRILILVEDGASLVYSETILAGAVGFLNIGAELVICANANLTHSRIAAESDAAVQIEEISITVGQSGSYRLHNANFGSKLSRTELHVALNGNGAEAHLSGVSVLEGGGHADVTTHIEHAVGNTRSTQLFKNVAGGISRAVYQGKITVAKGANGSDSRQTAKALLLGERAEADLKPELEIFADDVKCAHGAAVGDLDAESLFYLRARGIPEAEARGVLIRAFLEEALMDIRGEGMRAEHFQATEAALGKLS
jgi:Fe-S cluster assembly protein SufD